MGAIGKLILTLLLPVLFVASLIYGSDNSTPVSLAFLNWQSVALPVAWWVILAFLVGGVLGYLVNGAMHLKIRLRLRRMAKEMAATRNELDKLRMLDPK